MAGFLASPGRTLTLQSPVAKRAMALWSLFGPCWSGLLALAEPLYREALLVAKSVPGEQHPNCLVLNNYLATTLIGRGRLGDAEALLRQVLETRRQILGYEDRDTLVSMNKLAEILKTQVRFGEAEPLAVGPTQAHNADIEPANPNRGQFHLTSERTLVGPNRSTRPRWLCFKRTKSFSKTVAATTRLPKVRQL